MAGEDGVPEGKVSSSVNAELCLGAPGSEGSGRARGVWEVGGEWGASSWQLDSNGRSLGTHRNLGLWAILATSPAGNRWAMI